MKITKAVIPAARLGTHVLPVLESMPKEMLPIVDEPAVQYIVREAVHSGITDILIITNRGKGLIEDHFDRALELEAHPTKSGANKEAVLNNIVEVSRLANIYFVRQKETRSLGHAVDYARSFIGNKPFTVLYDGDVIIGKDPACDQLIRAYEKFDKGVLGVNGVSPKVIGQYSSLKVELVRNRLFCCTDMIEKPSPNKVFSYYSILGRCVLPSEIFDILDHTPSGNGEGAQLASAMRVLAQAVEITTVEFVGKRYNMGNKLGILQTMTEVALGHPEVREDFRKYIKETADTLQKAGYVII